MRRGFTLVEALIVIAIVLIVAGIALQGVADWRTRQSCLRGHYEPTGAMVCTWTSDKACRRYEPETRFVCDEWKAEATR
jgi:prepilin-type N-terminal cleavage/methylation domain-containing protein